MGKIKGALSKLEKEAKMEKLKAEKAWNKAFHKADKEREASQAKLKKGNTGK